MTSISEKIVLKIGSKGEIFTPKKIRKKLGLEPNQSILMTVHQDKLIIRKLNSIEDILKTPSKVKISYHAWKQFKEQLSEEYER
jgi:AbrB family looped-hinge helix DNA binding protein